MVLEGVQFRSLHHEPTPTSEDSARVRGEDLKTGAKALLLRCEERFALFVLSAARRLDSKKLKKVLNVKNLRFATPEELLELTGLVPGAVPPFGEPVLPFPLYIDESIVELDRVAFNAGSLTTSVIMNREDYQRLAGGTVLSFSRPAEED